MEKHRSTSRALDILEIIASSKEGYTLTEISDLLGAPRSSLFSIIHTLADRNFIYQNPQNMKYSIGINAYAVGCAYVDKFDTYKVILEEMAHIVSICMETCQLGILDKKDVLYIGKVDSTESIRLISHIGKRLPAYCTSLGKALISQLTFEELNEFFQEPMEKRTEYTITGLQELYRQLLQVRADNIAYDFQEAQEHVNCLAVPLHNAGRVIAAISVSVPVFRFTDEKEALIKECLLDAKKRLESVLEPIQKIGFIHGRE